MKAQVKKPPQTPLNEEQFTLLAIEKLAQPGRNTVHVVFSGFNEAFRQYFPDKDPVKTVQELVTKGKISFRHCKGGAIIGKPGVIASNGSSDEALKKMGLGK